MMIVPMNRTGPLSNGFAERNHNIQDAHNQIRDGVMGDSHGLSQEDESRLNEDNKDEGAELVEVQAYAQAVIQKPQQQSQGPLVHWERFLPLPSLKVLLVENDDSTRHVVCALLRNCGYEVMAVANGLQAWQLLEDLTNHIDLILTEVVMPHLSGIGLLSKIMSHKTHKNIPVIMMSSHDSMNIVFKCLSKGAVDFLVKPIRKNELKNLWQHVWRKCHSASGSGSGSESAVPTKKSAKSRSADESDNNTGSNDEADNGSVGLNARDGSDNGSGTQGSWTKRAVEVDSPKATSPWDQLSDPPDSTCARVIHSRPEECDKNGVPTTTIKEHEEQDDEHDSVVMGKDLEIGVPRVPNLQLKDPTKKVLANTAGNSGEKFPDIKSNQEGGLKERKKPELNSERCNAESRNQDDNVNRVIANITYSQIGSVSLDIPNGPLSDTKKEAIYEDKEVPSLELSLKRVGDSVVSAQDRNVLRHSGLSAFSRYNSASTASQAPIENVGSCSPLDISSDAAKTETTQKPQFNSISTTPNQNSNGSGNDNDMGSSTDNAFMKPLVMTDKPARHSTVKHLYYSSAFHPVQNNHRSVPQPLKQGNGDAAITNAILAQTRGKNQQVQVQCHHHYYDHHHYHVHNMPQLQQLANHDDLSLKNKAAGAPKCGSSNMMTSTIEGNAGHFSLDGSASGSDQGSNGQNGSGIILNPRGTTMDGNNGIAGEGGTGDRIGFVGRASVGQNHFALREAALNKFRQKRKERCFEKKVRYQSRKKLAEQRPRVRGQFVRQVAEERKDKDPCC